MRVCGGEVGGDDEPGRGAVEVVQLGQPVRGQHQNFIFCYPRAVGVVHCVGDHGRFSPNFLPK